MEIMQNMDKTLDNFYFDSFSSYIVFSLFMIGLIMMFVKKEQKIIWTFLFPFIVFLFYIFKSGFNFYHQNYYIIPIVPVMALVAGYALSLCRKKWIIVAILIIGVGESISNQQHDFFIKDCEKYKMSLEPIMNGISHKNDLIVINGNGNPQMNYLSHRKGWNCTDQQLYDHSYLNQIIAKNCKYIIINKHSNVDLNKLDLSYNISFENEDFLILNTSNTGNSTEHISDNSTDTSFYHCSLF